MQLMHGRITLLRIEVGPLAFDAPRLFNAEIQAQHVDAGRGG
jgi:hypothetical protein